MHKKKQKSEDLTEKTKKDHNSTTGAISHHAALRARGRRALRTAGQSNGSFSYSAAQQLRAFLSQFVAKVIDPVDGVASTAFFVNERGFLLTCWHVLEPDFAGTVRNWVYIEYRGQRYRANFLRNLSNRNKDIAVLRVQGTEFQRLRQNGFEVAPLAFPYQLADPVAALGYQRQDVLDDALLLRGYIDPDNTLLPVELEEKVNQTYRTFAIQRCLATVFRHAHFDLGMSGAPLLDTRTGCVVGLVAGCLRSSHSPTHQPLGFSVPLSDVSLNWQDFAAECDVLDYESVLDDVIVPQSKEFLRHEDFTERPHWWALVEDFVNDPNRKCGYLLLVAGEGEGKSAFLAHCVCNAMEPVCHFIRRTESGWDDPERMLRSLTAQL